MIGKPVLITYREAPDFRVHHADGIFGGATANGSIALAFYSEAPAKPAEERVTLGMRDATHEVKNELGADAVRTYHAQFLLPPGVAHALHVWLGQHLAELRKARGAEDML